MRVFIFMLFLSSSETFAQTLIGLQTFSCPAVEQVSADRYGNLVLADRYGNIFLYDSNFKQKYVYSPMRFATFSVLEARQTVKIYAFSRELQEITILNRFLQSIENYRLENDGIGFARLVAPATDGFLWLFDEQDFTIKKFDKTANQIVLKIPLDLILASANYEWTFMGEYQNLLFLHDSQKGFFIFDNMGNFKRVIAAQTNSFCLWENEFYWIENAQLKTENIYSKEQQSFLLPKNITVTHLAKVGKLLFFFETNSVRTYKLPTD